MKVRGVARRLGLRPLDVALVVGLLVLGYWNLWWAWDSYHPEREPHLVVDSVTVAVATLALLGRRRAPVTVLLVVNVMQYGPDLFVPTGPVFWGEWVPSLVAAYSVAAYRGGRFSALPFVAAAGVGVFAWRYPAEFRDQSSVIVWFGAVAVTVAAGMVIGRLRSRSAHLQLRTQALEAAQTEEAERAVREERARIARELHDVIAHRVSIMVVQAGAAENTLAVDVDGAKQALHNVQAAGREALEEMRLLLGLLRDSDAAGERAPVPSVRRLDAVIEPLRRSGMDVTLVARGVDQRIPPSIDVSAYRVVQEALTNAFKHAMGSKVVVTVEVDRAAVRVEVRDHGGAAVNGARGGHGLLGLRERVAVHGGTLHAGPESDGGFTVRAELPIAAGLVS